MSENWTKEVYRREGHRWLTTVAVSCRPAGEGRWWLSATSSLVSSYAGGGPIYPGEQESYDAGDHIGCGLVQDVVDEVTDEVLASLTRDALAVLVAEVAQEVHRHAEFYPTHFDKFREVGKPRVESQ